MAVGWSPKKEELEFSSSGVVAPGDMVTGMAAKIFHGFVDKID